MFKPPKGLSHKNLDNFLRSLDIYMKASGLESKGDETKIAILLYLAGRTEKLQYCSKIHSKITANQREMKSLTDRNYFQEVSKLLKDFSLT